MQVGKICECSVIFFSDITIYIHIHSDICIHIYIFIHINGNIYHCVFIWQLTDVMLSLFICIYSTITIFLLLFQSCKLHWYVLSTLSPVISIYTPTSRYLSPCILIYSTITDFKYCHAFICQNIYSYSSTFICTYSMITV